MARRPSRLVHRRLLQLHEVSEGHHDVELVDTILARDGADPRHGAAVAGDVGGVPGARAGRGSLVMSTGPDFAQSGPMSVEMRPCLFESEPVL